LIDNYIFAVTKTTSKKAAAKKLKKVKSVEKKTELSLAQIPFPLSSTDLWVTPNLEGQKLEGQGMVFQKSYFDGKAGGSSSMQAGKKELTADEITAKNKSVGLFPEMNYATSGMTYELVGIESLEKGDAYVLKINDGSAETYDYFDTKSFMKIRSTSVRTEGEETVETSAEFGDFKEVNGLLFPHKVSINMGEAAFSGVVKSIVINGGSDLNSYK
jgi:zinc protease